jgi:hypothetical protein
MSDAALIAAGAVGAGAAYDAARGKGGALSKALGLGALVTGVVLLARRRKKAKQPVRVPEESS